MAPAPGVRRALAGAGGRWWALLLRAGLLALRYLVALALALALMAPWSLLF